MTVFDYVRLCRTMYDYIWICMTMHEHVMTFHDYVWLSLTMYEYVWLSMRERKRAILKTFSYFFHLFETIKIFQTIQIFPMIQMFSNFPYSLTNLDFVYFCLPLVTFVYLCETDASMHKFCACFISSESLFKWLPFKLWL